MPPPKSLSGFPAVAHNPMGYSPGVKSFLANNCRSQTSHRVALSDSCFSAISPFLADTRDSGAVHQKREREREMKATHFYSCWIHPGVQTSVRCESELHHSASRCPPSKRRSVGGGLSLCSPRHGLGEGGRARAEYHGARIQGFHPLAHPQRGNRNDSDQNKNATR